MNRRSIMTWIATLMAIPTSAKASALLGQSQGVPTLTAIETCGEELKVFRQASNQIIKTLAQILDDPDASDNAKSGAANIILDHHHGIPFSIISSSYAHLLGPIFINR